MQMKLKFQVSQATNLDTHTIIERILMKLKDEEYRVVNIADNNVIFDDDDIWRIIPKNIRYFRQLQKGKFEIHTSSDESIVDLKYSEWILIPVLVVIIVGVTGVIDGTAAWGLHFAFCLVVFLGTLLRIVAVRDESKIMLREILK